MSAPGSAQAEIGPDLPPRWRIRRDAHALLTLAQIALDYTIDGVGCDVGRAAGALDRARAVLGLDVREGGG